LNSGKENVTSIISVLVVLNLPAFVIHLVVLFSSVLMHGSEVYASKILLLAPVSASALSRCSSFLTMRLVTDYQQSDWLLGEMILLA
jgi:hypothetical protein